MFTELQGSLEIEKQKIERRERFKRIVKYSLIFIIFGILITTGIVVFMEWYTPSNIARIERLFVKRQGPAIPTPIPGSKVYQHEHFQFSYPNIYSPQYETTESVIFSGRQFDGQKFPSVLTIHFSYTLDHESMYPCSKVTFRQGITTQCRDSEPVEKEINGYHYREFFVIGGKGGEEKLHQRVIQFLHPQQIEITHLIFEGVENRMDEILPTFHFQN